MAYSVLMSVYYKENAQFFRESIDSMVNQTIPPDDFVIICDGKLTEELNNVIEEITKEHRELFQIIRIDTCGGLGNALNVGISYCKYNIVARMDSDDIAKPYRMEKQLAVMREKNADIVSATVEEFDKTTDNIIAKRTLPLEHEDIVRFAKQRNPFNHPCVCFKKQVVLDAGSYKEFPLFEDYYLWARMLKNGAIGVNVYESVLFMRSGENMYARRGGFAYAKKALKFRWHLKKMGFSSMHDFVKSAGVQIIVSIMPNKLRQIFYKKVLRK